MLRSKREGPRITHGGLLHRGTNPMLTHCGEQVLSRCELDSGQDYSTPNRMCNILPTLPNAPQAARITTAACL